MDPLTIGILVGMAASGAAAALGLRRGRQAGELPPRMVPTPAHDDANAVRVGTVLTHLDETYWLAGEITLTREGSTLLRVFNAPQHGDDRWIALPRDAGSVWVLEADPALASMGWPGLEIPARGKMLRRTENTHVTMVSSGEGVSAWNGRGRLAMLRALDVVALVLEVTGEPRGLALVGREIPWQLVQTMG